MHSTFWPEEKDEEEERRKNNTFVCKQFRLISFTARRRFVFVLLSRGVRPRNTQIMRFLVKVFRLAWPRPGETSRRANWLYFVFFQWTISRGQLGYRQKSKMAFSAERCAQICVSRFVISRQWGKNVCVYLCFFKRKERTIVMVCLLSVHGKKINFKS